MKELPSIFSTEMVYDLSEEAVLRLAGESEQTAAERNRYTEKLEVLEAALHDLKRLDKHFSATPGEIPAFI